MTQMPWLALSIDRSSKTSVFEQICQALRGAAIAGELAAGSKLPPTRAFATELGVSRSTVVTAYEQLVAEGYLSSLPGSGYTVCAIGEVELPTQVTHSETRVESEASRRPAAFEAGQPDMRLFPHRQWAKAVARVCRTDPQSMLVGGSPLGNIELRQAIAAHVAEWRGVEAVAEQIIVTAGSTDALELCMRSLAQRGDTVAIEDPGYQPIYRLAQANGLVTSGLALDDNGAILPDVQTPARLVVLTPSQQYPLGGAMSPNRRLEFINWARARDGWVIEDDYDSEFRYAGRPIPAMAGFDGLDRTIYIGSFSKIFSNSLRLGYVIVPQGVLPQFRQTVRRFGVRASYMPQQALADFMGSGEFYRHLRRVRRTYGERRKFLLESLTRDFGEYGWFQDHQAGMQVVFHLHEPFVDHDIAEHAARLGVTVQPLSAYAVRSKEQNGLILGFCGYAEEEMTPALELLKGCFTDGSYQA